MTDPTDTRVKAAVLTLHLDLAREPTEQKVRHIKEFIYGFRTVEGRLIPGNDYCVYFPTSKNLYRYFTATLKAESANFSPKSIAHLDTVAKEVLI